MFDIMIPDSNEREQSPVFNLVLGGHHEVTI
mgnify:CR=1 FL=1|jgi:hypothetical protein